MKIVDNDWQRFEDLASHGIKEPPNEPIPPRSIDILDILSLSVVLTFVIGLIKKI